MPGVLDGIRVVDWTLQLAGPTAGAMLGDLGADVIHVEERGRGDIIREMVMPAAALPHNRHVNFEELNRNKRGIAVDMKKAPGREVVYRLVQKADVFLTNYRSKVVHVLGMDYATLRQHNPRLIYAISTGQGRRGPDKDAPFAELMAQARSGVMMASGEPGAPPARVSVGIADRITGIDLAYGILAALLARERYGFGQEIHTSQLGAMIFLQGCSIAPPLLLGQDIYPRRSRTRPQSALGNEYLCKDGRWIIFTIAPQARRLSGSGLSGGVDQIWSNFCKVIGMPELEEDPRFADQAGRAEHAQELVAILDKVFLTKDAGDWLSILRGLGDFQMSPVNTWATLMEDPQVLENDYITLWDHPVLGPIQFPGFPMEFSETPLSLRLPAPDLGQHTREVLLETGYSEAEIDALADQEVI